jgi:hypothetical protein
LHAYRASGADDEDAGLGEAGVDRRQVRRHGGGRHEHEFLLLRERGKVDLDQKKEMGRKK